MWIKWIFDLFDATRFMTRGHCGPWSESLKPAYIASNLLIAIAYLILPLGLLQIWRKRRHESDFHWILLCFAAFISACGITHLCDVAVFWWPCYRLFTLVSAITATLSVGTALTFPWVLPILLALPSPERFERVTRDLERNVRLKDAAIADLNRTVDALRRQVDHLERMRQTGPWVAEQESALRELKSILDSPSVKEGFR
jgi:hypothetical protein